MSKISEQIEYLSDNDLAALYIAARRLLKSRRLLDKITKIISKEIDYSVLTPELRKSVTFHSKEIIFSIIDDDWKYLFSGDKYDENKDYYVYYHANPNVKNVKFVHEEKVMEFNGKPFYFGKGKGDRYLSKARSRSHISMLNKIESIYKKDEIYHIWKSGLSEIEALELEAKLITIFGCESEIGKKKAHISGFCGGMLINADPARRPQHISKMISIRGLSKKD